MNNTNDYWYTNVKEGKEVSLKVVVDWGFRQNDLFRLCIYLFVSVGVHYKYLQLSQEDIETAGARITGSCESPELDSGNQT